MDWKIELIAIPVTDVDRAKAFYVDQVGFHADHDHQVTDALRFVQLTPPGSACSIVLGTGITQMPPGSQKGVQCVVADVEAARQQLIANGVQASDVDRERGPQAVPPPLSWPRALRAVRAWLTPWTVLQRWWTAWSKAPPPPQLQALINSVTAGCGLNLHLPP